MVLLNLELKGNKMNMKFIVGGLMATMTVGTYSANAQSSVHDGLYMGIEGSYAKTSQTDLTILPPDFEGVVLENDILSATSRNPLYTAEGAGAGVFLGYRASQGKFTLASEISYAYSFISNEPTASTRFEQTNEFGASLYPGIWVDSDVVVFGQIGFSQLKTNSFSGLSQFNNSDSGLIFGGGVQAYLSPQVSIRASYSRSTHNHQTNQNIDLYEFVAGTLEQIGAVNYRYDHAIKRDKFSVSMIYNF